jgi:stage IV sporulation protein FB
MVRKMLPPIHIHPVLIAFIGISIVTGTFIEMILIFSIVFIHEMGHYGMAKYFGWRIKRVMLWVFGGVMETEEHGNKSIKEEMLVAIAGPIQHLFIYALLFILMYTGWITEPVYDKAMYYNTVILLFNLLPVWPLDGGKLLFLGLSMIYPYKQALHIIFLFSLVLSLILGIGYLLIYPFTLTFTMIMLFLFLENRLEWHRRMYIFMRFLMERYRGNDTIRKIEPLYLGENLTLMEVFSHFKREKKHPIFIRHQDQRVQIDETDCMHAYFYEKEYNKTLNDLFFKNVT